MSSERHIDKSTANYILKSLFAGGVAGCAAKTVVAPLDRVKILFQTGNKSFEQYTKSLSGIWGAVKSIQNTQGILGLFQGHSATLLRIFPYAAIKFMTYEQLKVFMMPTKEYETHVRKFLAGSIAGCTSVFISYPLDLVRVRMAFEVRSRPVSISQMMSLIYAEPNVFWANPGSMKPLASFFNFYRGFLPTFYGMIPYAGVSFYTYDTLKQFASTHFVNYTLLNSTSNKPELRAWALLVCGAVSGAVAQTSSYPLEVIRRHMQVATISDESRKVLTTTQTAQSIWRTKGFRGFWVGLTIGYMKVTPMFAVSFYTYEWCKKALDIA